MPTKPTKAAPAKVVAKTEAKKAPAKQPAKKPATAKKAVKRVSPACKYTLAVADDICKWVSEGQTLREYCRKNAKDWSTIYNWIKIFPDFAEKMEAARKMGAQAIAEDIIQIMDETPERTDTQFGDKVDAGFVQWQKNRAEQRLKLLAKWHPKEYGDKLDLTGNLTTTPENVQNELVALLTSLQPKQKDDSADN